MNQPENASAAYRRATELNPADPSAWLGLGLALAQIRQDSEAIAALQRFLAIQPDHAQAHNDLGNILRRVRRVDEAAASFQKAIAIHPQYAEAIFNLALTLADSGQVEQAVEYAARAAELAPEIPPGLGFQCYAANFRPGFDRAAIAAEMRRFNERFAAPLSKSIQPHDNDRAPDRRLRIGYVSPDFFFQAECFFFLPLLKNHDRQNFEIHCYSSALEPDDVTRQIRESADVWHDVAGESDEQLAQRIRADRIDILIDLTMHMRHNRLLLFAQKPAPIQVTWLAYPGGTGVAAIDYRLTDRFIDPPDTDRFYAEKSVRLPDSWCCYDPLSDVPVGPDRAQGFVRFGSLNNPSKLNDQVLKLWSRVLQSVPESRLLLLVASDQHRSRIRKLFSAAGIEDDRLEFTPHLSRPEYLRLYDQIDVCLDPLPYNGITTTLDALSMGVPVVTLAGSTAPGRAGLSILTTAGMPELIARTPDEFIQIASRARDLPPLNSGRTEIRRRLTQSPLMDAKRFAANIESAYRKMWNHFIAPRAESSVPSLGTPGEG